MDLTGEDVEDVEFQWQPKATTTTNTTNPDPIEEPKCTIATAIRFLLEDDRATECWEWAKTSRVRLLLDEDVRSLNRSLKTAKHMVDAWETACASRANWAHATIPTLSHEDVITVGALHRHLSEILAAHPTFAATPVHHHECHGVVETTEVEFDIEGGFLGFR